MEEKITLRAARVNSNLTLKDVSEKVGISINTLHSYETGKSKISAQTATFLCDIYNININNINFF